MKLICVPPDRAAEALPLAREYIKSALDKTSLSDASDVIKDVLDGKAMLWIAAQDTTVVGAGVTMIITINDEKFCEIVSWGARDHKKCAPLRAVIHDYAEKEKCSKVRFIGRKGWARSLPEYKIRAVIMEKAV